jgi:FAD/FMN-containing dehydrogenase
MNTGVYGAILASSSTGSSSSTTQQASYIPAPATLRKPSSANIVMTTIRPLNISVDEASQAVWVDGGVKTSDLLEYLKNSVSPTAPAGWTLGAFPWFVHQTIAGAVATNSHGSSLKYKSLSDQVGIGHELG